jgi:hypothetical protein
MEPLAACAQRWTRSPAPIGGELRFLIGGTGAFVRAMVLAQ